jgi:hypothetical protein
MIYKTFCHLFYVAMKCGLILWGNDINYKCLKIKHSGMYLELRYQRMSGI